MAEGPTKRSHKYSILFYLVTSYLTNIYITAPSIPDESTADPAIDTYIVPKSDWPQAFPDPTKVIDVLRELPDYILIPSLPSSIGASRNLDQSVH